MPTTRSSARNTKAGPSTPSRANGHAGPLSDNESSLSELSDVEHAATSRPLLVKGKSSDINIEVCEPPTRFSQIRIYEVLSHISGAPFLASSN